MSAENDGFSLQKLEFGAIVVGNRVENTVSEGEIRFPRRNSALNAQDWTVAYSPVDAATLYVHFTGFWFRIPDLFWLRIGHPAHDLALEEAIVDALACGRVGQHVIELIKHGGGVLATFVKAR